MENVNAPGKGLLKVTGVLGIIFGAIGCFSSFIGVSAVETMNVLQPLNYGVSWEMYYVWAFIGICFSLYFYIMALVHCANLEKASFLKTLWKICIVFVIIDGVAGVALIGISAIYLLPISFIFLILYHVGASRNEAEYNKIKSNNN